MSEQYPPPPSNDPTQPPPPTQPPAYGQPPAPQPYGQPPYGQPPVPQPGYATPVPGYTGEVGKVRSTGLCILLFIVTFGIYGIVYYYMVHDEMKRHSGRGIGGVV